ncbi:NAD(P)-dependent malic enzyme [Haliovirga abyssi]|uniref:Malate dehydrogenase n=1 Tax=Haliovirga abyssi TaxID=2996794 RepID=A0AAU9DH36_9FUSO|nr:NADP-dependent malic enzyme [Haliovirga abyssi]BDU50024.1 malate dehydrogenase [Haliovirga abyssi]
MSLREKALKLHREGRGKLEVKSKFKLETKDDLALLYTPGVAEPCKEIAKDKEKVYEYTTKGNTVAVVTDGTAVLGLGDIGPEAALPVMEGKAILFKEFADIDAIPICLDSKDVEDIVKTVKLLSPSFGGINLEDISAPRCFEIEARLIKELDIPVFHDDQHGTGIVVLAGILNSLKLVKKKIEDVKIVINGGGAAGTSIAKHILSAGAKNLIVCDLNGAISSDDENSLVKSHHRDLAKITNPNNEKGNLKEILKGADVFVGVSRGNLLNEEMVKSMAKGSIVFAMANPVPEIMPDVAKKAGATVVGSGRSDFPNQINNILAFPGIFRGALDARVGDITEEMKLAASYAIAGIIEENEITEEYVIPSPFDRRVANAVAEAVKKIAKK